MENKQSKNIWHPIAMYRQPKQSKPKFVLQSSAGLAGVPILSSKIRSKNYGYGSKVQLTARQDSHILCHHWANIFTNLCRNNYISQNYNTYFFTRPVLWPNYLVLPVCFSARTT